MEQDQRPAEEQQAPPRRNRFAALIPKGDYFFTPIIININIAVYLLMILSGVDPMFPDAMSVLKWGANIRLLTMNGEAWRLLTAAFLHYGLLHIAVNMFSLYQIGRILEPFIGRWRFLVVYLCSAIGASVVSMWWRENGAAAGASGAIVGIMGTLGVLMAIPNFVRQEIRMELLRSIGTSLLMLVAMGFSSYIDNAGHFGGLAFGAICGLIIFPEVKKSLIEKVERYYLLITAVLVTAGLCFALWMITPKPAYIDLNTHVNGLLDRFAKSDQTGTSSLKKAETVQLSAAEIESGIIRPYQRCVEIGDSLVAIEDLSDEWKKIVVTMEQYAELRITEGEFLKKFVSEKDSAALDSALLYGDRAALKVKAISKLEEETIRSEK